MQEGVNDSDTIEDKIMDRQWSLQVAILINKHYPVLLMNSLVLCLNLGTLEGIHSKTQKH